MTEEETTHRLTPSFPYAVKRSFFFEKDGWDAHVKVDYDEPSIPMRNVSRFADFLRTRKLSVIQIKVFRTRKGYHLRAWLDRDVGPYTTLSAQRVLGDDPIRQAFNARRVRKKRHGWNVLFNEKWRGGVCVMKEEFDSEATSVVEGVLRGSISPRQARIHSKGSAS